MKSTARGVMMAFLAASAVLQGSAQAESGTPAAAPSSAAPTALPPGEPRATYRLYSVTADMQASSSVYRKWPGGGTTWFHGIGFLMPFGAAEFYCGENFPEAKEAPITEWQLELFKASGVHKPMFCIYLTSDGRFYLYESPAGVQERTAEGGEFNQMIYVVVDGTGPYKGANGFWTGVTAGRGASESVEGRGIPPVLLQVTSGYVKIPLQ